MKRAVFLDRDGVLNPMVERNGRWGAPLTVDAFALYPWTAESVTRLKAAGLLCLVATNQPEIATGELDVEALEAMHRRLVRKDTAQCHPGRRSRKAVQFRGQPDQRARQDICHHV